MLFSLDEMGQVDPHEAGVIVYTLANGLAKGRSRRDLSPRPSAQWRILIMSSGEITLGDKMAEVGKRRQAGQEVRLVDIPADAGAGKGAFEDLHGEASPAAFADRLRELSGKCYGHPIREYVDQLTRQHGDDRLRGLAELIKHQQGEFLRKHLPGEASGQVHSVARRFGLIAAGGRFATEFGITGWKAGEAEGAAAKCFDAWLERRGTAGEQEVETGIRQVRAYLEAHGSSRFEAAWESDAVADPYRSRAIAIERTANRVGFRKRSPEGLWEYFVLPEQWRSEVAKGHDAPALARAMIERGLMVGGADGKSSLSMKVPGLGNSTRLYALTPALLNGG
jgi:putative DNA primase/helicase